MCHDIIIDGDADAFSRHFNSDKCHTATQQHIRRHMVSCPILQYKWRFLSAQFLASFALVNGIFFVVVIVERNRVKNCNYRHCKDTPMCVQLWRIAVADSGTINFVYRRRRDRRHNWRSPLNQQNCTIITIRLFICDNLVVLSAEHTEHARAHTRTHARPRAVIYLRLCPW